jgi:hypothetical protein
MKLNCAKSGIVITAPEFRLTLAENSHNYTHPIFSASPKSLVKALDDFNASRLSEQEIILLFLAIADNTRLIHWRQPFAISDNAAAVFSTKMNALALAATRIIHLKAKGLEVPEYVCETRDKQNTAAAFSRIVTIWTECIEDFSTKHANMVRERSLLKAEEHMQRAHLMMRKRPATYARAIASWASMAGEFPVQIICTAKHAAISVKEHWEAVIISCVLKDGKASAQDIAGLLEYCEQHVPAGTIHAFALFESLRAAYAAKHNYYGFSISSPVIAKAIPLTEQEQLAKAKEIELLKAMRVNAPKDKPTRNQFATDFAFLRAMAAWNASTVVLPPAAVVVPAPASPVSSMADQVAAEFEEERVLNALMAHLEHPANTNDENEDDNNDTSTTPIEESDDELL